MKKIITTLIVAICAILVIPSPKAHAAPKKDVCFEEKIKQKQQQQFYDGSPQAYTVEKIKAVSEKKVTSALAKSHQRNLVVCNKRKAVTANDSGSNDAYTDNNYSEKITTAVNTTGDTDTSPNDVDVIIDANCLTDDTSPGVTDVGIK